MNLTKKNVLAKIKEINYNFDDLLAEFIKAPQLRHKERLSKILLTLKKKNMIKDSLNQDT